MKSSVPLAALVLTAALAMAGTVDAQWTLSTDDTCLKLSVSHNRLYIDSLATPAQNWNWTPAPAEVPLPGKNSIRMGMTDLTPDWTYCGATEDKSKGYRVTLRFTSATPNLELKSIWSAQPGPGPVENWVTIENKSGTSVTYHPSIAAARIKVRANHAVHLHYFDKTQAGIGVMHDDAVASNAAIGTNSGMIPYIVLDVGSTHGLYLGYEWELGGFTVASAADPLDITASACPLTEDVTQGNHEIFTIPNVYYGVYQGDLDDGSNRFKKWFWNYKITRSLHDHANEPWTEVCMQAPTQGSPERSVVGSTPQSLYDCLAATGVEAVKMDYWDGSGNCWYTNRDWTFHANVWPNGFDYAKKAHQAGLKASLYMGGTYNDCDLTTVAGRDAELSAVLTRYDKGWFDMWRTDLYSAPREPIPQSYLGVTNFLYIQDHLIANRPGYRYENCCNGGKYKGFAICRRMTFCTMNDVGDNPSVTRTTYYANSYAINPVQLKSDLGPTTTAFAMRTDMLGAILTWAADNPVYRQHIALYKSKQRPILRGADVYHILPMPDGRNWDGVEYFNTGLHKGSVFLFKPSKDAAGGDSKVIRLRGLDRDASYALTFQDRTKCNCVMTGAQLMDQGIAVTGMTGDNASEIIWIDAAGSSKGGVTTAEDTAACGLTVSQSLGSVTMTRFLALVIVIAAPVVAGAEEVVWQIGKADHDYAEFAIAGNYQAYAQRFLKAPVVFEVGRSKPARDWPFIHPGPADGWAGGRVHPWTIRFALAEPPRGVYTLRIDLVDVHKQLPPKYRITLGDRNCLIPLEPGAGDASLTNARAGKPQRIEIVLPTALLRQGTNEVVLACTDGSWVQYDAITLLHEADASAVPWAIGDLTVRPTRLFVRRDGRSCRVLDVCLPLRGPVPAISLQVEAAGQTATTSLAPFGPLSQEVDVPDSADPLDVTVRATAGKESRVARLRVLPQRKWRVYVGACDHTDIGYTDVQPKCAENHCRNIEMALDLMSKYPEFVWNLETAYQADMYLRTRKPAQIERFLRAVREGRLGVQALYCNELTGLCSPEEICRLTAFAHNFAREHGTPYRSAMINDVPTQEATLPMILANAGIRYLSSAVNNDRAYPFTVMQGKCPCWWEGPDGSRVLMMYFFGYAQATYWGLLEPDFAQARKVLMAHLEDYERRTDYPFDAVFIHGEVGDNAPLNPRLAEVVHEWNQRYEYPRLILAPTADFFQYIDERYGRQLPVFRGSAGTYWEDGAGSSARETTLARRAQETVGSAEKLFALAAPLFSAKSALPDTFRDIWRNCILYDEHTWGAWCSIEQPESEFTKAQWNIKAQYALDADRQSAAALDEVVQTVAGAVQGSGRAVVVLNPTSWQRSDIVQLVLPPGTMIDPAAAVSYQGEDGITSFLAKDVPACGYRVVPLNVLATAPPLTPASGDAAGESAATTIESRFYRVRFDPSSGAMTSIVDKETGRELVDAHAAYGVNQYLYVGSGSQRVPNAPTGRPLAIATPRKATLRPLKLGEMGSKMIVETTAKQTPSIRSEITLWNDVKRIDIVNQLTKTPTYDMEAAYFAFPFALRKPVFRYEVPAGIVCANRDMLPGACLDWFTVQHFLEMESADGAITWATPDAPLACFQDINRGKWQTRLDFVNGHVYAYLMNNYWHTNYQASQGGDYSFRFALTSRARSDRVASVRMGWEASNPLLATAVELRGGGPLPAASASFLDVAEPNVIVIGAKRPEEGNGVVVRLWELSGKATTAHLRVGAAAGIPGWPAARKATACTLVEAPGQALPIRDGAVAVPLRKFGLATVRIE